MKVTSDRAETIYRHDKEDRTIYTMKLVKKNMDAITAYYGCTHHPSFFISYTRTF